MESGEIRVLPGKIFDYLDAGEEFLEKFRTLVGENCCLLAGVEHESRESGLDRCHNKEDGETGQSTQAQVDQEDDHADHHLDRSGPDDVEETASRVNARNISGDVVDQFSVGVDMSSTCGECESLAVDRSDQTCVQQCTSGHSTVGEVL